MRFKFISFGILDGKPFIMSRHYNYTTALNYASSKGYKIGLIKANCNHIGFANKSDKWKEVERNDKEKNITQLKRNLERIRKRIRSHTFDLKYMARRENHLVDLINSRIKSKKSRN